jgi:hypothetical protein
MVMFSFFRAVKRGAFFSGKRRRLASVFFLLLTCGFLLASCGKKPASVDPPEGVPKSAFPRPYPDIATDPKP